MAAMSTALTEFSDNGDSITYVYTGHTVLSPKLVLQKRRVPSGNQIVQEDSFEVLAATVDADGAVLTQKIGMKATVRTPITGSSTDVTAALVIFRDIVASDEFTSLVTGSNKLA